MNSKKKTIILSILGFFIGILAVIGIGYAYFMATIGSGSKTDIDITSSTSDKLTFTKGDNISLNANQFNFIPNGSDLSATTTSSATLVANSNTKTATVKYQAYFNIIENGYIYTKDTVTPEIILTVTKPDGTELTAVEGLTYVTISDTLKGFDITTKSGLFTLAEDYAITSNNFTAGVTQEWIVKITYRNLDTNQEANEGKILNAEVLLQKEKKMGAFADIILANNGGASAIEAKGTPNFANLATTNEGMYAAADDYGTSYYFRGAVDNNWVKFAGFYWRIVRINGDGSVKLIYTGTTAPTESQKVVMTGDGIQIGISVFNSSYTQAEYAGYMYTLGEAHGTGTSSTIKTTIDTWYASNLASYSNYLSDTIFCNDRTVYTDEAGTTAGDGIGKDKKYYGSYIRNKTNKAPILTCPNKSDAFTVSDTTKGNGALTNPVGLITADEVAMAGGVHDTANSAYYLNTNSDYWLASPGGFDGYFAYGFLVSSGFLYDDYVYCGNYGARLSVSLDSNIQFTGSGQWNDPYLVQ